MMFEKEIVTCYGNAMLIILLPLNLPNPLATRNMAQHTSRKSGRDKILELISRAHGNNLNGPLAWERGTSSFTLPVPLCMHMMLSLRMASFSSAFCSPDYHSPYDFHRRHTANILHLDSPAARARPFEVPRRFQPLLRQEYTFQPE